MRPVPPSQVVLTDGEKIAHIRSRIADENPGQPQTWLDDLAAPEIAKWQALQAARQAKYDGIPPTTPFVEPT